MTFHCQSIRIVIVMVVCIATPYAYAAASCDALDPCAAKACRLDADMAQAKAKGNASQLARLQQEHAEMAHCSDDGLKQKRKVALEQAQHRIDQRTADLKQFEASGDAVKIKKAQRKLESARKAYSEIESSPL
jgi:Protein of unknown function (DUF1090)